ncbi:MAG: folate-binding protein YgfZ [Rhodobacteraceae bacterium]|nr:folate-binding protein YgfZ [Paracoccaceae bacterium]
MAGERAEDRRVFTITGADREKFLQNIVTNDLKRLRDGIVYTALLTPQGKYLADFFLVPMGEAILLDVHESLAADLVRRLTMYKLRADAQIAESPLNVSRGLGPAPEGALPDPRHPELGWRLYSETEGGAPQIDWDAIRVAQCIPETGIELIPNDTFLLEAGFERLNGVDFRKGCYVGQEVTARMKHKTELKKGLAVVEVSREAAPGTPITADGKPAGTLYTRSGDRAIAYLRFDRAEGEMQAGEATVRYV